MNFYWHFLVNSSHKTIRYLENYYLLPTKPVAQIFFSLILIRSQTIGTLKTLNWLKKFSSAFQCLNTNFSSLIWETDIEKNESDDYKRRIQA